MDHSHLSLFDPQSSSNEASHTQVTDRTSVMYTRVVGEARVAVSVGDLVPLLAEAWQSKRAWLGDFSSDRVIISQDLYEILLAYKRMSAKTALAPQGHTQASRNRKAA